MLNKISKLFACFLLLLFIIDVILIICNFLQHFPSIITVGKEEIFFFEGGRKAFLKFLLFEEGR